MKITALIPAAGQGRRMGRGGNKQYLDLLGRPLLTYALETFERHPRVHDILLVVPQEERTLCLETVVKRFAFRKVRELVAGGDERQDSVRLGLEACSGAPEDLVLIHDGARPLVSAKVIDRVLEGTLRHGACLAGVPVKDTVKEVAGGLVRRTPERATLWQAQTPQGFRLGLIRRAHREAWREGFLGTDDAMLVERLGLPVAMVEGDYRNLKITTPGDLGLARELLQSPGEEG